MGNCPTCSLEHEHKSLDPLCNGKRMWTTFLFSSLVLLLGGSVIIFIYEVIHKLFIKSRRIAFPTRTENVSYFKKVHKVTHSCTLSFLIQIRSLQQQFSDDSDDSDDDATGKPFNWQTEIKEWGNNIISGQTKTGKTFVGI